MSRRPPLSLQNSVTIVKKEKSIADDANEKLNACKLQELAHSFNTLTWTGRDNKKGGCDWAELRRNYDFLKELIWVKFKSSFYIWSFTNNRPISAVVDWGPYAP